MVFERPFFIRNVRIFRKHVIKVAESGNIFGGYTAATWDHIEQYKSDKSAFIFSLVNKEMKPVKVNAAKRRQQNYQN
jgi:hypothetical protein